jgi:hypothetical protein
MRWLLLILLISVVGMLFAAFGLARHVMQQRARRGSRPLGEPVKSSDQNEEVDVESKR